MSLSKTSPSRLRILYPLACCLSILALSSIPGDTGQNSGFWLSLLVLHLPPLVQNSLHIPVFAGLAWSWVWALRGWHEHQARRLAVAFLITASYAALDEWHQSFVLDRTASSADFVLDLTGALLGLLAASQLPPRTQS